MKHPLRLVLLVVAALMLLSLDHGLPERYVPDDTVVRCALGMARDLGQEPGLAALVPPAGKYTTYPYLLPYVDLGALGLTYVAGRLGGRWGGMGAFAEAVFDDPSVAWLPARLVSVLLALLVPLSLYRVAREFGRSRGEAALAALLGGTSLLLVQYAHTTRPWAPMLGFGAASVALTLRLRRRPGLSAAVAAFVAAALAGASLQVGLAFLAVPVTGLVCGLGWDRLCVPALRARLARAGTRLLVGGLAATLVLGVLGYPHLVLHGAATGQGFQTGASSLLTESGRDAAVEIGGQAFDWRFFRGRRWQPTATAWLGYDPVLVLAGLAGLLLWLADRRQLDAGLLVVAPALFFAMLFLAYDGTHVRYMLPAQLFLSLSAARLLCWLARRGRLGLVVALAAVSLPLCQAARLDLLLGREDTRSAAARQLALEFADGALLAMDGMGTQYGPPLTPRAATLQRYLDDASARARGPEQAAAVWLTRSERRILEGQGVPASPAVDVVPIQRYWRYDSYYPSDFLLGDEPVELATWMDAWGIDVYVQVDRLPDAARRQPVTDLTAARGRLLWELSPTGRTAPRHAELPTDMAFALTDLWQYERPGPWVRVWRLESGR